MTYQPFFWIAFLEGVRGALAVSNPRVDILTAENLA